MTANKQPAGLEKGGFVLFLALVTLALLVVVLPFARPLLWATLAAITFQPLYQWLLPKCFGSDNKAAAATLLIITVAIIIPAFFLGSIAVEEMVAVFVAFRDGEIDVAAWFTQIHDALPAGVQTALDSAGFGNLEGLLGKAQDFGRESTGAIASQALSIGSSAFGFVLAFGVGLYAAFFLLRDGRGIGQAIVAGLPMERSVADRLAEKFLSIVRATIKGSVVVSLVQGALGAITFVLVGVPSAMLFGLLMAIFSLLPALGPAIVWGPVAIWLLATGEIWQGIAVIGSGVLVIGMADNVLRPILVGRDTGIPDWIILVTTLGGIGLLGLSGIVVGPLVAGLFLAGWTIAKEQREAEAA
ncbi:AI-2E family transporter [Pontixanthobacter aestiaquae]|uniref:AI-2E family transporter n=1 Tax=Pontixanthobacter aestiaquae TaxID=1509367 RepID=A0A844Z6B8_9SPHN|nr:AI-2E family transporter [Pontixanthobacter aestiaquae]MDN3646657.1 AI-2E family transporter [Pontixanthobacter aestiaquae]MXO82360.1 AI-2E family transporter [Pontixanthobacter aestiaquae]